MNTHPILQLIPHTTWLPRNCPVVWVGGPRLESYELIGDVTVAGSEWLVARCRAADEEREPGDGTRMRFRASDKRQLLSNGRLGGWRLVLPVDA